MKSGVKRFYERAAPAEDEGGYGIELDGRGVRTPAGRKLLLPTEDLARAVAEEWAAQGEKLDPERMPFTKMANTAIDGVATQRAEVRDDIARYAGTDLLCYRADTPEDLAARQEAAWTPLLDWARDRLDAPAFCVTGGVMAVDQAPELLAAARAQLEPLSDFALVPAHRLTALTTSYVLMLGVLHRRIGADEAFALSRLDEDYQQEFWGKDAEAEARAETIRQELLTAERFLRLAV